MGHSGDAVLRPHADGYTPAVITRRRPARVLIAGAAGVLFLAALGGLGADAVQAGPAAQPRPVDRTPRVVSDWASATVSCNFKQIGDPVRLTGGPGSVAIAPGGWSQGNCPVARAEVSVQLQARHDGEWRDIGDAGTAVVKSGERARATFVCHNSRPTKWRSVIDVDLLDSSDDSEKLTTPARTLSCCPDPSVLDGP